MLTLKCALALGTSGRSRRCAAWCSAVFDREVWFYQNPVELPRLVDGRLPIFWIRASGDRAVGVDLSRVAD